VIDIDFDEYREFNNYLTNSEKAQSIANNQREFIQRNLDIES